MARTKFNPLDQSTSFTSSISSPVSASNTATDVTFASLTVAAGDSVGACFEVKVYGQANGTSGSGLTFWIAVGGAKVVSIPLTLASDFTGTALQWHFEGMVTLSGSGTAAAVYIDGELLWNSNINTSHVNGSVSVNQTNSWAITCGATWSVASASNAITARQGLIARR
jgi:hypothetical protein